MSKYSDNMPPDLRSAIGWLYDEVKPGSTFLDFGCATGYFGSLLKKNKNCKVDGVEISDDIKQARKVLDTVYSFDIDGEWPDEIFKKKYKYVFYGDVLEHLKDPEEALRKTLKILDKNGIVFVSTPNIAHISTRLELLQGNFEYESMGILDSTHLKYFTLRSFSAIANNAGYSIHSLDYTTNDYPKEVIQKILDNVGLTANEKFWKMTQTLEARTFQFKFMLKKSNNLSVHKKNNKISKQPLPQKPEQFRDGILDNYKEQIDALKHHADEQGKVIKHLATEIKLVKHENELLKRKVHATLSHKAKQVAKKLLRK
jgi:2-polyprenyl-3-methyl-5-hydroxy-6-metoxy-1,4-benzoquinol methylase